MVQKAATADRSESSERVNPYPLDPLSAEEIGAAARITREQQGLGEQARFVTIALHEPDKESVRGFRPGDAITRRAALTVLDRADGSVHEAVVDLGAGRVESWRHCPGAQPYILTEEFVEAAQLTRANEDWRAALRRRGVSDFDKVQIDPWPAGNFGRAYEQDRRILRAIAYVRDETAANGYARPIEGVVAVVDTVGRRVLEVIDEGDAPVPSADIRYDAAAQPALREDRQPLEISQPDGVSFSLEGHELRWQKWRMRVSLHPREGLVLHTIGYEDGGEVRSVCYRAGLSEMVVPYGDPSAGQYFKNAFDSGEVGLGRLTNALQLGCDCLGEIRYMEGIVNDGLGNPVTLANAICIHEEDFNLLWKHTDGHNENAVEVRRSRRLVVSSWATVGNYDYGFFWYFYEDGSIEHEIKLTGIVQTMAVADGEPLDTKHLVAKNLAAPIHQHFFSVRMDMEVDGPANSVYEVDAEPLPAGPENPYDNAFRTRATLLARESEAQREVNPHVARHWKIVNPGKRNAVGLPVAYALYPGETVGMMAGEAAAVSRRATFARKQLWVTRYASAERYAAGDYPNQHPGGAGLPAYQAADRALENTDVVLWYTVGVNHVVRPEDFPVAPVHRCGFTLKPWGFFDSNPALDVAPPDHCD